MNTWNTQISLAQEDGHHYLIRDAIWKMKNNRKKEKMNLSKKGKLVALDRQICWT